MSKPSEGDTKRKEGQKHERGSGKYDRITTIHSQDNLTWDLTLNLYEKHVPLSAVTAVKHSGLSDGFVAVESCQPGV